MSIFVHTADGQLGLTRHLLADEAQARFTAARIEAISHIGALAVGARLQSSSMMRSVGATLENSNGWASAAIWKAGRSCRIIVLTSTPGRHASVGDAPVVQLAS